MLTSIVGVIILLGGLIFFHELGHYSVAKFFGVKVEVFSLGFGKKIFRKQVGETEYCLSLFPLGGYVKLMGDDPFKSVPASEVDRAFYHQKLYKRFLIVAAGPLANVILAYFLFVFIFWAGKPVEANRIGTVNVGSPAWEAGIRPRDRILVINGKTITTWDDMEEELKLREGERVQVIVDRNGKQVPVELSVGRVRARNDFGEEVEVGGIKGISAYPVASMVGVSDPNSLAFLSGLRTGDLITQINGEAITLFEEVGPAIALAVTKGEALKLLVKRPGDISGQTKTKDSELTLSLAITKGLAISQSPFGPAESLGVYPSELFVKRVTAGSPAEKGGLQAGDRIVKVGDNPVFNFETIVDEVQARGNASQTITLQLQRSGQTVSLTLQPVETTYEDPLTHATKKKFMVGFEPMAAYRESELTQLKVKEPLALLKRAWTETWDLSGKMLVSLGKLAMGQISMKNLGGPVLIASVAGKSLDAGIIPFLQMMALISINLFLLNLFPVPVLDGGHLLFFLVEGIKGKPVSVRTMEIANQIGMVFILMLVGLTLFNDISRIVLR